MIKLIVGAFLVLAVILFWNSYNKVPEKPIKVMYLYVERLPEIPKHREFMELYDGLGRRANEFIDTKQCIE